MRPRSPIARIAPALLVAAALAGAGVAVAGPPASARSPHPRPPAASAAPKPLVPGPAWPTLVGPEARAAALGRQVTAELRAAGVPAPAIEEADIGAALGQFDSRTWVLRLSQPALAAVPPAPSSPEARALAATAHHEGRHAEQWFRMAQLRAADGRSAAEISAEMALPPVVAGAAAAHPLDLAGEGAAAARGWWASIYGPGAEQRNQVLAAMLAAKSAYDGAARSYRLEPSPVTGAALVQARQALDPVYAAYRALPEEADAFAAQAPHEDRDRHAGHRSET